MKRALFLLLLAGVATTSALAADRTLPPVPGAVPAFTMPVPVELTLKNGLKVHFLERHRAPLVDVVAVVGGGGLADPAGHEGAAVALADLLTQGAADRSGLERDAFAFDDAVKGLGASVDAWATWTTVGVSLHVASSRFGDALPLFADAVLRPRLTVDDWERKRGEKLGELAYYKDEPRTLVGLAASRTLFGSARPGTALMGTPTSLQATSAEDLRGLHRRVFRPDNAFLVVVGDIDKKALTTALESAFGAWAPVDNAKLEKAQKPEPKAVDGVSVVVVNRPGAPQSALQIVAPVTTSLQPLDPPTQVMRTLLGGSFTSRLNTNLREEHGYSYGASYSVQVYPWHRSVVSTSVATAKTIPALDEIFKELTRIRTPAAAEEVDRARSYEALGFPGVLDGGRSLASTWAGWKEQGLSDATITGYMGAVLKVDGAGVEKIANTLVDPKNVTVVIVGDHQKLAADLAKLGPVKLITADELLP